MAAEAQRSMVSEIFFMYDVFVIKDFVYQIIAKLINVRMDADKKGWEKFIQVYWRTYMMRGMRPRIIKDI